LSGAQKRTLKTRKNMECRFFWHSLPCRVIAEDLTHSETEKRYFCFGEVGGGILTVRFTYRGGVIRIFGAGYWRKGKSIYERENQIHR
jgi:uncharacterized DUF497 family protein